MSTEEYRPHNPTVEDSDAAGPAFVEVSIDSLADAFVELNAEGQVTAWNQAAVAMFGWSQEYAIGRAFSELVAPGNPANCLVARLRDGRNLPVQLSFCTTSHDGLFRRGVLVRDRSHEEEPIRELLDQIPVPVVEVDLRGNYRSVNQAYREAYQISGDRTGVSYKSLMDEATSADVRETYKKVYATGQPARHEYPFVFPDGRGIFIENFVALRKNSQGERVGFISVNHDCTERRRFEIELREAKEKADAANKAKSEFLAHMSHEIRTPLNGVMGLLQLASSTDLKPEQRELLGMAQESAGTLLTVLNDILDFSKIEAGRLDLETIEFDLAEMVADAIRTVAVRAHEKGLELAYNIAPEVPEFLLGDPSRLKQVLLNLIGNAVKFTNQGEVILNVEKTTSTCADKPVRLTFSVSDTGIGIAQEKLRVIFEAFSQADGSTTRKFGGTGLGLAICSRIVKMMGSRLRVESELGSGSTFSFTIDSARTERPKSTVNHDLSGLRVLIVDENSTNRLTAQRTLVSWGCHPMTATSGVVALRMMTEAVHDQAPFALVILDARIQDMDGFQLAAKIRDLPAISCPILMTLPSNRYLEDSLRCRELGIEVHLIKPVRKSDLGTALRVALKGQTPAASTESAVCECTPRRILLAEDNLVNQKLVLHLMKKLGHHIVVASTGRQALKELEQASFDVVLMDIQMPDMDGFEATKAIREEERRTGSHLPIIALTAHALSDYGKLCIDAGMDEYLSKPIDIGQLRDMIERLAAAQCNDQ